MKTIIRLVGLSALLISFTAITFVSEASETSKNPQISNDDCDEKRGRKKKDCRDDSNSNSNGNRNSNSNNNRNSNRSNSGALISSSDARKIALGRISGKVVKEEFERENGHAIYEIYIRQNNGEIFEVYVDAENGDILKVENKSDDDN